MNNRNKIRFPHWGLYLGLLFAVLYWLGESILHVFFFEERSLRETIFPFEDPNELWMRLFIVGLFILLATTFDLMYIRLRQARERSELLIRELREAIADVKTLSGLVPICSVCKRIRDDAGYWHKLEKYLQEHSDAEFSHGYCPSCAEKAMREIEQQGASQENNNETAE